MKQLASYPSRKDLDIEILSNAFEVSSCPHPVSIASKFCPQAIKTAAEQTFFEGNFQIKPKINELVEAMGKHLGDISRAKSYLAACFDRMSDFIEVKLFSASKKTQKMHKTSLSLAQPNLLEEEEELKRQFLELGIKRETVNLSLDQAEKSLSKAQEDVAAKREIVSKIESEPYLSKKDVETLEKIAVELQDFCRDLTSFNLFT
ncbi:hypothetical protein CDL12_13903 [Handroanthus impetiginosus]|uniref:Uncharacterized protein n=1 Tax=Handroanthus impetiginosus TaxID=429701 RepID=A0A2G9H7J3_9LAMI|nr:hypothetical protein CDL12_13903 [Handroanthus impetiginosus]